MQPNPPNPRSICLLSNSLLALLGETVLDKQFQNQRIDAAPPADPVASDRYSRGGARVRPADHGSPTSAVITPGSDNWGRERLIHHGIGWVVHDQNRMRPLAWPVTPHRRRSVPSEGWSPRREMPAGDTDVPGRARFMDGAIPPEKEIGCNAQKIGKCTAKTGRNQANAQRG